MTARVENDGGYGYSNLTARQREYHNLVAMGVPSQGDAARAMGVTPAAITQLAQRATEKHPDLVLEFHKARVERAIDLFHRGRTWREIAEACGYRSPTSAYATVQRHCGSIRNIWMFAGEDEQGGEGGDGI